MGAALVEGARRWRGPGCANDVVAAATSLGARRCGNDVVGRIAEGGSGGSGGDREQECWDKAHKTQRTRRAKARRVRFKVTSACGPRIPLNRTATARKRKRTRPARCLTKSGRRLPRYRRSRPAAGTAGKWRQYRGPAASYGVPSLPTRSACRPPAWAWGPTPTARPGDP
jgi:hypothetical protein